MCGRSVKPANPKSMTFRLSSSVFEPRYHDVRRLQVAVHDPGVVSGLQRVAELAEQAGEPLRVPPRVLLHQRFEGHAGDVLKY